MSHPKNVVLVWLRHTLRLHDNPMLAAAQRDGKTPICVTTLTPREQREDRWGHTPMGPYRKQFLRQSIDALRTSLHALGGCLLYVEGDPLSELQRLAKQFQTTTIYADREYAVFESRTEDALDAAFEVHWFHSQLLTHPDDTVFTVSNTPHVFSKFRRPIEKYTTIRPEAAEIRTIQSAPEWFSLPEATAVPVGPDIDIDPRSAHPFAGGEAAGLDRLHAYLWETKGVRRYKATRNGLIGTEYSTKFSAYLALGCLSPKRIYNEIKRFEAEVTANQSTYWVIFEVLWREFFRYTALKEGASLFCPGGIQGVHTSTWLDHKFEAWKNGQTGQPFVDANMNELRMTGFMSNRGRQNTASYLVHDLKQDWRAGASWFEHCLVDYDPCSNYGNWNYVAGIGNDPKSGRRFDPVWQSERYDAKGAYQDLWQSG